MFDWFYLRKGTYHFPAILFVLITCSSQLHSQVNIIFDTDIGSDCDDAGALAVLHKLAEKGEVNILGVIFSSNRNKYGIGVCDAINTYYGSPDLPLGQYKGTEVGDPRDHYCKAIALGRETYGHDVVDSAEELVTSYKKLLRKQPDKSVTIVSVGHPHGLSIVMKDSAGLSLINEKVKEWVAMAYAGAYPRRDWNFGRNGAELYIAHLLAQWPTDVYFSSAGTNIITGNKKLPLTPPENPVRKAYELWNNALEEGRSSWDQVAVLFSIRPHYFTVESRGSLRQNSNFETFWDSTQHNSRHHKVTPLKTEAEMEIIIEDLMSEPPEN